jgi:hypothetical protein
MQQSTYLGQNIEPDVDVDSFESFRYSVIDALLVAVREPESQQSKRIL